MFYYSYIYPGHDSGPAPAEAWRVGVMIRTILMTNDK